jgi:hypothetical protein
MIIDGVLVGVVLAGLELGIAWILACVINHEPSSEKKEEKEKENHKLTTKNQNLLTLKGKSTFECVSLAYVGACYADSN